MLAVHVCVCNGIYILGPSDHWTIYIWIRSGACLERNVIREMDSVEWECGADI
jgi:hypothetical protein